MLEIRTDRLRLLPATLMLLGLERTSVAQLGAALGARVPDTWPPDLYDDNATRWLISCLEAKPEMQGWLLFYVILDSGDEPVLVGTAGYKGPANAKGEVEIGYGIVSDRHRQGLGTETARGLMAHAFGFPEVHRVTAATFPDNVASLGVMARCGMKPIGAGPEEGTVLWGLDRREYESLARWGTA